MKKEYRCQRCNVLLPQLATYSNSHIRRFNCTECLPPGCDYYEAEEVEDYVPRPSRRKKVPLLEEDVSTFFFED